jgi:hypothetical protein
VAMQDNRAAGSSCTVNMNNIYMRFWLRLLLRSRWAQT